MRLFLIRHAQSENNARPEYQRVEDPGLTPLGQEQAELLADWIPMLAITRIIASPFRRTLETALPLQRAAAVPTEVRTALHEVGGCYSGHEGTTMVCRPGLSRVQIEREFPAFRVSPEINGQGWWTASQRETEAEAGLRAQMLFEQTVAEFGGSDERIALVMHADFKVIFLERFHREPLTTPCNTSVSTVEVEGSAARLVAYNSVRHLPAQLVTV